MRGKNPACVPLLLHMLMNPVAGEAALSVLSIFADQKKVRDYLLEKLKKRNKHDRLEAALILTDLPFSEALPLLKKYAADDDDLQLRAVALGALAGLLRGKPAVKGDACEVFVKAAKHPVARIRQAALQGLAAADDPRYDSILRGAREDPDPVIRNVLAPMWLGEIERRARG